MTKHILLSAAVGIFLLPTFASGQTPVSSTVEINDSTANGPSLSNTDLYGYSVASLGDLDGDGVTDIAVGSRFDDQGGNARGAVHISFLNADGSVKSTVEINSATANGPTLADSDFYGSSVSAIGDLDGDGVMDIAVGATGDDEGGNTRGAVHISFLNTNGSVKSTVEINSSTANGPSLADSDGYGQAIAALGDLDGDGVEDIAVGANGDDEGGSNRGAVHISFLDTDGSVKSTVEINSSTANGPALSDQDQFGRAVAALGDLDGDGVTDIAVGAPFDDEGASNSGAVHIAFLNANGTVKNTVEINSSTLRGPGLGVSGDEYGTSIASLGDYDGDGVTDIAVAAPIRIVGISLVGTLHISFLNADGSVKDTVEINTSTTNGPTLNSDGDTYGASIASLGDLNGDGRTDIVVGATLDDEGGINRGAVHISFLAAFAVNREIAITGNSTVIPDGSTSTNPTIGTDFGDADVDSGVVRKTFIIANSGNATLHLSGTPSVSLSGSSDFTVDTQPFKQSISGGGSLSFRIEFRPTTPLGTKTATVSIANTDLDENPYTFTIEGNAAGTEREINVTGDGRSIPSGSTSTDSSDGTDFGDAAVASGSVEQFFSIFNNGDTALNLTGNPSVTLSGSSDFRVKAQPNTQSIASGLATQFRIEFRPTTLGAKTATVSIPNNDQDENPYTFTISGNGTGTDTDGDGLVDTVDTDDDNDGIPDDQEVVDGTDSRDSSSFKLTVSTSFCSEWNGFLGLLNIAEFVNLASSTRSVESTLFSISGAEQSVSAVDVLPGAQMDLLVHDMTGFQADSYGKVCSSYSGGTAGDIDGRMVHYRMNGTETEFAFAMSFNNGLSGSVFAPFNTFQPSLDASDGSNPVVNWITILNLDDSNAQGGTLFYYGQDGSTLGSESVSIAAGARQDFAAHQFGANLVGTVEWRPTDSTAKFQARNVRYLYDNPSFGASFDGGFQLEAIRGSNQQLVLPLDTRDGSSIVEISNTKNEEVTFDVSFYGADGTTLSSQTRVLPAFGNIHIIADQILDDALGSASVKAQSDGKITATVMQYGRTDTNAIKYLYGIHGKQALGSVLRGTYNNFLDQGCRLLIVNSSSTAQNASISMRRFDGTDVLSGETVALPANGTVESDVCANDSSNTLGVVSVQPDNANTIVSTVIRLGNEDSYRFPTPVR